MTTGEVILIIIILTVVIIIRRKIKNKPPSKKQPKKVVDTADSSTPPRDTNTPAKKGKSLVSKIIYWCIAIMAIAIAVILISVATNSVIKTHHKLGGNKPDKQYRTVLVAVDSITVYFDGDLTTAKETHINPIGYDGVEFSGATQPFCVYNAEGDKFCAEKGGNPDMGNSTANRVLRFVSQNEQKGKITIKLLRRQKIVVN